VAEKVSTNFDKICPVKKACLPPRDIPAMKMNYTVSIKYSLLLTLAR